MLTFLIAILLVLAGLWLAFLVGLAVLSGRRPTGLADPAQLPRFIIIVPAHNEAAMIAGTVSRILHFDYPKNCFSLYVVADNCDDNTAELARGAGAVCLERRDGEHRGKGYALDFVLRETAGEEADAILFLDADSYPEPGYLRAMARHLAAGASVVQGRYEARTLCDTWFSRLTAMSFELRNRWVFPAFNRLGWPVPLRGSGMLFARGVLADKGWDVHGLTEDLEMTLRLFRREVAISFAPDAVCGQYMPATPEEAVAQRRRWSAGEGAFRRELLTRELTRAVKAGQWGEAGWVLYLVMPGLSAQLCGFAALFLLSLPFGGGFVVLSLVLLLIFGAYVLFGGAKIDAPSIKALAMVPVYAVWRCSQAIVSRVGGGSGEWVRTSRPDSKQAGDSSSEALKIVMLGIRGVPANYGGFETCVEEIGWRLAARGHHVTVYCRTGNYADRSPWHRGMRRIFLPAIRLRALETLSHTFLSSLWALFRPADVFLAFNAANIPSLLPLLVRRAPLAVNTDGLEWKRGKWGRMAKTHYKLSERAVSRLATRVVTDSRAMADYYRETYRVDSTTIAYGAEIQNSVQPELLNRFGLKPREYFLQITRFEPENNPLLTVQAFLEVETDKKVVLVGGASYIGEYQRRIAALAGGRVIMPGFIYEQDLLRELWTNCHAYVHGNEVGGTNPALLQAMGNGCFVICRDVVFNREVLGEYGRFFLPNGEALAAQMRWSLENEGALDAYRKAAQQVIRERYSWDDVAARYERLCLDLHVR